MALRAAAIVLLVIVLLCARSTIVCAAADASCSYRLDLTASEYSQLHDIVQTGIEKHGGDTALDVVIKRVKKAFVGEVWIRDAHLLDVLEYWTEEEIARLVSGIDFGQQIDEPTRLTIQTAKRLYGKIQEARGRPICAQLVVGGMLRQVDEGWMLEGRDGGFQLLGVQDSLGLSDGEAVVVRGQRLGSAELQVASVLKKEKNTLEMFVMSECPYARKAEVGIVNHLLKMADEERPNLVVRYIFYRSAGDSVGGYTSLHGAEEVKESAVQIGMRDGHPECFERYLLLRAERSGAWDVLAREAGLSKAEVEVLAQTIKEHGSELIAKEYASVAGERWVYDGSPSFFWEGEPVRNLRSLVPFRELDLAKENCAGKP